MNKPLKIAIYSGDIPSTTFIERLVLGLSEQGHALYLFGFKKGKTSYPSNVKVVGYKHTWFSKLLHLVRYSLLLLVFKPNDKRQLDTLLKQSHRNSLYAKVKYYPVLWHQPDIFHIQWAKSLSEWAWVQMFGMKLVLSLRGAHINYSPVADAQLAANYQALFPKVDGFHAVSKAIAKVAQSFGADQQRTCVIYSGLDAPTIEIPEQDEVSSVFQILSVGRSHWIKGYSYALDACKQLKDAGCLFHYTIIGALGDIELAYHIEDLGLQQEVTLTDAMPFERVQKAMQQAAVLVLPSVEEGIANVVLEAMALGTLVVTTDCGGMDEVIEQGVNGFLVPVRAPKALAESLLEVMRVSKDQKARILANAKATIAQQHTRSKMVQDMEALYQNVMNI